MMSAKTVLTETPVTGPTPAAPNNAGNVATPGGEPSDFRNLLAGAAPTIDAPPALPLVQLLNLKQNQAAALAATSAMAGLPGKRTSVSPADLLRILNDSATLLPNAGGADPVAVEELAEASDDAVATDEDTLVDWLDGMLPPSVFAPQAGSTNFDGKAQALSGEGERRNGVTLAVIPAALMLQAGLPGREEALNPAAFVTPGPMPLGNREAAAAQGTVGAFAAALNSKTEAIETDTPSTESWMSALGDLSSKRGPEMAPLAESRLSTPVHDARWADALAHRLVMMARDGESVASLKLVPVELGPLDIQISVRDGEATVHFGAAHQETRALLEASLPRLREMLSAQGLELGNASVSHQSAGQNRPERSTSAGSGGEASEDAEVAATSIANISLLDTYA